MEQRQMEARPLDAVQGSIDLPDVAWERIYVKLTSKDLQTLRLVSKGIQQDLNRCLSFLTLREAAYDQLEQAAAIFPSIVYLEIIDSVQGNRLSNFTLEQSLHFKKLKAIKLLCGGQVTLGRDWKVTPSWSDIQELHFYKCKPDIDFKVFANLRILRLHQCELNGLNEPVLDTVTPQLRHLHIEASFDKSILLGLQRLTALQSLHVNANGAITRSLWKHLRPLHNLISLKLACCRSSNYYGIEVEDVGATLACLSKLQQLHVNGCCIPCCKTIKIFSGVRDLQDLSFTVNAAHRERHDVRMPFLPRFVSAEGIGALATCRNLSTLSLAYAHVTREGLLQLSQLTALASLDLKGVLAVDDEFLYSILPLTRLSALCLSGCPRVSDIGLARVASSQRSLTCLDISDCCTRLTDHGLRHLQHLPALSRLSVANCDSFTPGGLSRLIQGAPHLRHLNLRCCHINEGVIACVAQHLPHLLHLLLDCCRGVHSLSAVACLTTLKRLHTLSLIGLLPPTPTPTSTSTSTSTSPSDDDRTLGLLRHHVKHLVATPDTGWWMHLP